ncbi:unnamed protein product [Moneuplotes crassus]|uniref:Uncharacterized protein n=1 Tax=Euplotes crassus TaxID=5936 RepID=A0AAD1Y959_EUPCR|nr:unnamed protein product [Moneuplotes crassus]
MNQNLINFFLERKLSEYYIPSSCHNRPREVRLLIIGPYPGLFLLAASGKNKSLDRADLGDSFCSGQATTKPVKENSLDSHTSGCEVINDEKKSVSVLNSSSTFWAKLRKMFKRRHLMNTSRSIRAAIPLVYVHVLDLVLS